jgi:hypothetical protein
MRRSFATAALLAAFAAAACSDTAPTGTRLRPDAGGPLLQESVSDYVDRLVVDLFPKGLETATGSRWETVKQKLAADDFDGATKHLRDVAKYVKLKTPDITLTSEFKSKEHAAASLVYSMALYVYRPEITTPPTTGRDVAFEVVPAGEAATIVTPSEHAALDIPAGSTNEDRLITIIQDPNLWPGHCNGPLPTKLCQYPLFYDIASFPSIAFNNVVGVAVCAVTRTATADDRGPLDRPGEQTVHHRLRLARPFTGGPTTPRGTLHPETNPTIEILPLRENQRPDPLTDCSDIPTPVASLTPRGGWLGRAERGMLAVANFAAWVLTPKDLYAFDSGPEHETMAFGSPFNTVDPASQPDLEAEGLTAPSQAVQGDAIMVDFTVANTSRRIGGESTAAADATTATVYLVRTVGDGDDVGPADTDEYALRTVNVAALRPDASHVVDDLSVTVPADLDPGSWILEVRVAANSGLTELTLANNQSSQQITVDPLDVATTIAFDVVPTNKDCVVPEGDVSVSPGCGQFFTQGPYVIESFWFIGSLTPTRWTAGHFHVLDGPSNLLGFEAHHFQHNLDRQGVWIRRADGGTFSLKSIAFRNAGTPFEIGTSPITEIVGTPPETLVNGYTTFAVPNSSVFATLATSGFANVTQVWITMRGGAQWDDIVLTHVP